MAFKTVQSLDADVSISLGGFNKKTKKDNPTTITGYYLGSKQVPSPKAKSGFASLHFLQTENGNVAVWGKTDLDRKIASIATNSTGSLVRITQTSTKPTKNGNDMYIFQVEVDDDNRIDVDVATSTVEEDTYTETNEEESVEDDIDDEVYMQAAKKPQAKAALPDSARQQKVRELLNRSKTA